LPVIENVSYPSSTLSYVYTGNSFEQDLKNAILNLPQGATVEIEGLPQDYVVGSYPLVVKISLSGYQTLSLDVTLIIQQFIYDFDGISYDDQTLSYTGEELSIPTIEGTLPDYVDVDYTSNPAQIVDEGEYTVTATFTSTNPNIALSQSSMTATVSVVRPMQLGYSLSGSNITITSVSTTLSELVIPETYDGYTVTGIASGAFPANCQITKLTIPDTVTSISSGALKNLGKLVELTIPFVGESRKTATSTWQYPFGYIFGTSSYTNSKSTYQQYIQRNATSSNPTLRSDNFHIPASLTTVTVTGGNILRGAFMYCKYLTTINLPQNITSIEMNAFSNCSALAQITIPSNVTKIGNSAFSACSALSQVSFNESLKTIDTSAFYSCLGLSKITIPKSVTSINSGAFSSCKNLLEIWNLSNLNIVSGQTTNGSIAEYALGVYTDKNAPSQVSAENGLTFFSNGTSAYLVKVTDKNATSLSLPEKYKGLSYSIFSEAFAGMEKLVSVSIPNTILSIGDYAFKNCKALKEITIPSLITEIGKGMFTSCEELETVNMHNGIITIQNNAFELCKKLKTITLYENLETIGNYAFKDCHALKELHLPSSVTSIGSYILQNSYSIEKITVPFIGASLEENASSTPKMMGYFFTDYGGSSFVATKQSITGDFSNTKNYTTAYIPATLREVNVLDGKISAGAFSNMSMLTKVTIPDNVTAIGDYAFYACSNLPTVNIPGSVTQLGKYSFYDCHALNDFVLHDDVTQIGDYAFANCRFTSFNMPDKLLTIGKGAFNHCYKLTNFTLPTGLTAIGDEAFAYCSAITEIELPNTLDTIGASLFANCTNLENVVLFEGMTSIPQYLVQNCNKITSIDFPTSVTGIGGHAFSGCSFTELNLPSTIQVLALKCFENNPLTKVTVPDSVTIMYSPFAGCNELQELTVPFVGQQNNASSYQYLSHLFGGSSDDDNVTKVPASLKKLTVTNMTVMTYAMLRDCKYLEEVNLPAGLVEVGNCFMEGCDNVLSLVIPSSLTTVGSASGGSTSFMTNGGLVEVYNLSSLDIQAGVSDSKNGNIGINLLKVHNSLSEPSIIKKEGDFIYGEVDGVYSLLKYKGTDTALTLPTLDGNKTYSIAKSAFYGSNLASVTMPNCITAIENSAFAWSASLTSVNFPTTSLKTIGNSAFYECALVSVVIPDSVTEIGIRSFSTFDGKNSTIKSVVLGNGLTAVAEQAFQYNKLLESVTFGENIVTVGRNAFGSCALKEVVLNQKVERIESGAFRYNSTLTHVKLSESLTYIDYDSFQDCNIKEIWNPSTLVLAKGSTSHGYIAKNATVIHTNLTDDREVA
ncbi:MAG: leucine-rich repeat domain-containing protein, partial [Clostridia bacterium]|nr:leucine-rich repeat domain-containing protein [Clostridia bacterium]